MPMFHVRQMRGRNISLTCFINSISPGLCHVIYYNVDKKQPCLWGTLRAVAKSENPGGSQYCGALRPESAENILLIPGARPIFLKAELLKESKNGFKNNQLPALPSNVFFKKLISAPKNWMFCLFLNFYGNIYG